MRVFAIIGRFSKSAISFSPSLTWAPDTVIAQGNTTRRRGGGPRPSLGLHVHLPRGSHTSPFSAPKVELPREGWRLPQHQQGDNGRGIGLGAGGAGPSEGLAHRYGHGARLGEGNPEQSSRERPPVQNERGLACQPAIWGRHEPPWQGEIATPQGAMRGGSGSSQCRVTYPPPLAQAR